MSMIAFSWGILLFFIVGGASPGCLVSQCPCFCDFTAKIQRIFETYKSSCPFCVILCIFSFFGWRNGEMVFEFRTIISVSQYLSFYFRYALLPFRRIIIYINIFIYIIILLYLQFETAFYMGLKLIEILRY